jgi:hypothetical protein
MLDYQAFLVLENTNNLNMNLRIYSQLMYIFSKSLELIYSNLPSINHRYRASFLHRCRLQRLLRYDRIVRYRYLRFDNTNDVV